jgi:hypothetical protein
MKTLLTTLSLSSLLALPALSSPALAYTLDSNGECESLPLRGSLYVLLDLNNLDDAGLLGEAVEIYEAILEVNGAVEAVHGTDIAIGLGYGSDDTGFGVF